MLCKIVRIVEMNNSFFVCFDNLSRKQKPLRNILADLSCHIITLYAVYNRILIRILLFHLFIVTLDQAQDLFVRRIRFTNQCSLVSVRNIFSCDLEGLCLHDLILYQILYLLDAKCTIHTATGKCDFLRNLLDLLRCQPIFLYNFLVRLFYCCNNI